MPDVPNPYCDQLGIPVPRLADLVYRRGAGLLDGLVVALLVNGGPMTLSELVAALAPLRNEQPDNLSIVIAKAWAGREPVVKDGEGRFDLDLGSYRLRVILHRLGLAGVLATSSPPPAPTVGSPETSLSMEEVSAACKWAVPAAVTGTRLAAAVLDAHDGPMTPEEIVRVVRGDTAIWVPEPQASPPRKTAGLVSRDGAGRLVLNRASPDLAPMRVAMRKYALPRLRQVVRDELSRQNAEEMHQFLAAREAAAAAKHAKIAWHGIVTSVQPRIRLTRSFDQRSHSYLGYVLRIRGELGSEAKEFVVAVGEAAHNKHQFRAGDEVSGEGHHVEDPNLETADLYKVSGLKVGARGATERSPSPPFTGEPPALETYRARGHRRLAAATLASKCLGCVWGCEMAVEMIIDQWNPSKRRYRRETWCYGPKNCALYTAGPTRKVPGRKGMSWTEEDWVDDEATGHRGEGE